MVMPDSSTLNESPSEKEGKCCGGLVRRRIRRPSMKVPPKRKGNAELGVHVFSPRIPQ